MIRSAVRTPSACPPHRLGVEMLEERELLNHGANTVSGEAFGVFADIKAIPGDEVPKTPQVVLPSQGGIQTDQVLCVGDPADPNLTGCLFPDQTLVSSGTLVVTTTGAIGPKVASSQSSATVEKVDALGGTVTSSLVVGLASCTGNGKSASHNAKGSTLLDLSINGVSLGDVTPKPNTKIDLPTGTGSVILNEQIESGDGKHTTALTVNMIHVRLNDPVTGLLTTEVVVSSAHCDVNFAPAPKTGPAFMTGGGRLGSGRDIATFGFHAGLKNGASEGQLQYIDHKLGINIHSTSVSSFAVINGSTCVTATGTARVNGVDGYTWTVRSACDNGEPGVGKDTFDLSVVDPSGNPFYARSGTLTGGNLQLHPV